MAEEGKENKADAISEQANGTAVFKPWEKNCRSEINEFYLQKKRSDVSVRKKKEEAKGKVKNPKKSMKVLKR